MPPLRGFSNNPLKSRDDVAGAGVALIRPLLPYFSASKSRVRVPVTSGTLFDETAAQLEGFARPLWVVGSLLMSREPDSEFTEALINGLTSGTDPHHEGYWGQICDMDQRMVEAETIAFALLASPKELLWDRLSAQTQRNISAWFQGLNGKQMPKVNWLWFRVFTNLVLLKICNLDNDEIRQQMNRDLEELDGFYIGEGWSSDGVWRDKCLDDEEYRLLQETGEVHSIIPDRCADYYSGSFAIQFSQLLYVRFAGDLDLSRTQRYCEQARQFSSQFWRYFDSEGVSDLPAPLHEPGAVKGFLLRHLRWWATRSSNIFHSDGVLNLGWLYPNMYLTEDYNSPQSVYWALKAFVVLGLEKSDPFWQDPEALYPAGDLSPVKLLRSPCQIICYRPGSHHFMLSSAQFKSLRWKGGPAKYCKFAYSSAFGFSVPTGAASLEQLAPDNAVFLSKDGSQTWASKWKCNEATTGSCRVVGSVPEELPTTTVTWYPWEDRSVEVTTTLIPASARWPDWYIRIHRIYNCAATIQTLHIAEGGFAIHGRDASGMPLKASTSDSLKKGPENPGGLLNSSNSLCVFSEAGTSGIRVLGEGVEFSNLTALQPEANTNIVSPRTLIPLAKAKAKGFQQGQTITLITKVFAVSSQVGKLRDQMNIVECWEDPVVLSINQLETKDCIVVRDEK